MNKLILLFLSILLTACAYQNITINTTPKDFIDSVFDISRIPIDNNDYILNNETDLYHLLAYKIIKKEDVNIAGTFSSEEIRRYLIDCGLIVPLDMNKNLDYEDYLYYTSKILDGDSNKAIETSKKIANQFNDNSAISIKVSSIVNYLHNNYEYDNTNSSLNYLIENNKGNSEAFSKLFQLICFNLSIKNVRLIGTKSNISLNLLQDEKGKWIYVDPTKIDSINNSSLFNKYYWMDEISAINEYLLDKKVIERSKLLYETLWLY